MSKSLKGFKLVRLRNLNAMIIRRIYSSTAIFGEQIKGLRINQYIGYSNQFPNAMHKLLLGLTVGCIVFMPPFVINNFVQGRLILGLTSASIVAVFVFNALSILRYQRYYPRLILFGLIPAVLVFLVLSIQLQGIIGVLWCYPAVIACYFILPQRQAWLANISLLISVIPCVAIVFDLFLATRIASTLLIVSLYSAIFINVITEQQHKLQQQAFTDPLTGTFNRSLLQVNLEQAIQQNLRINTPMTLITLDLDYFKSINDRFGHASGDAVLQDFALLLTQRCRLIDKIFRIGGEEFIVLLHNATIENGAAIAEELRQQVELLQTIPDNPITVSIGVAELQINETWQEWMQRSDENLYQAKKRGRNQVISR